MTLSSIKTHIDSAATKIPVTWPLTATIAVNPLWDLLQSGMDSAIVKMNRLLPVKGSLDINEYASKFNNNEIPDICLLYALKRHLIKKKIAFANNQQMTDLLCELLTSPAIFIKLNETQINYAQVKSSLCPQTKEHFLNFITLFFEENNQEIFNSNTQSSFFSVWKQYILVNNPKIARSLVNLPDGIDQSIQFILNELNIDENQTASYFDYILTNVIGWSSFVKWLESRPHNPLIKKEISLKEIIAVWLCYDFYFQNKNHHSVISEINDASKSNYLELPLYDLFCHDDFFKEKLNNPDIATFFKNTSIIELLLVWQTAWENVYHQNIIHSLKHKKDPNETPTKAQFVFCIDTRSEGMRRHIEDLGYQTFGYAGFFGCLFELEDDFKDKTTLQCPAIVEPSNKLRIHKSHDCTESISHTLSKSILNSKHPFSPFAVFEMTGLFFSLALMTKNTSYDCLIRWVKELTNVDDHDYRKSLLNTLENIDYEAYSNNAFDLLNSIGLTDNLADFVFICSHHTETVNNPFQASYECGACGGNSGYINAIVTCEILNNPTVRSILKTKGIVFGENTLFIAANHNTVTDELMIFDAHNRANVPFDIQTDIKQACENLRKERTPSLPNNLRLDKKATHWAEMIPEWGLANNACMIIGPRWISKSVNLQRRAFLHSYEPSLDSNGKILEGILTAPLIVAHWINMQYYFSATDPDIYGSGNKALHNIIPGIGVMEGNMSDLKIGLPLQSLFFRNQRIHQPRRLLVVVYANQEVVDSILDKHPTVKSIFDGDWATLHIINSEHSHELS